MSLSSLARSAQGTWAVCNAAGVPLAEFDTFLKCDVKVESRVADAPVEKESFASYNKTPYPGQVNVVLAKTGAPTELTRLLDALEKLRTTTELASIVTPEKTFLDYSLESYDYRRESSLGLDRLVVSLRIKEVRQVSPDYTNEKIPAPKNKADAAKKDAGKQQPQPATEAEKQRVREKTLTKTLGDALRNGSLGDLV